MKSTLGALRVLALLGLVAALAGAVLTDDDDASGPSEKQPHITSVVLKQCLVSLIDDVRIPAVEAGVLTKLHVREGDDVEVTKLLALIDDRLPKLQQEIARLQHRQAEALAENDVDVRYSEAAAKVSEAEYLEAEAANRIAMDAVAPTEVRRLQLTSDRSKLGIEQAKMEQMIAGLTHEVRAAELKAADQQILRRQIVAPVDGIVVEIYKHVGEWVQAGEPVLRVVRLNRLRVEGFVNAADFGDEEIVHCKVRVVIRRQRFEEVPGGEERDLSKDEEKDGIGVEVFSGEIVFVNPLIEASGAYRVWAEVDNHRHHGRWVLRPGMEAQMTIQLNKPIPLIATAKNGKAAD